MKLPKVSGGVDRFGVNRTVEEKSGVRPSCNPNEDCSREQRYRCPTFRNPGRWCSQSYNDPACLIRKTACVHEKKICQAGCRATQVAAVAACSGSTAAIAVCAAAAIAAGERCFNGC